jgi:hypothetical protein
MLGLIHWFIYPDKVNSEVLCELLQSRESCFVSPFTICLKTGLESENLVTSRSDQLGIDSIRTIEF